MRLSKELRRLILDTRLPDGVLRLHLTMVALRYGEDGKAITQADMARLLGISDRGLRKRLAWLRAHPEVQGGSGTKVPMPISTNRDTPKTRLPGAAWATPGGSYERGQVYRRGRFLPVRLSPEEAAAELEQLRQTRWLLEDGSSPWPRLLATGDGGQEMVRR